MASAGLMDGLCPARFGGDIGGGGGSDGSLSGVSSSHNSFNGSFMGMTQRMFHSDGWRL